MVGAMAGTWCVPEPIQSNEILGCPPPHVQGENPLPCPPPRPSGSGGGGVVLSPLEDLVFGAHPKQWDVGLNLPELYQLLLGEVGVTLRPAVGRGGKAAVPNGELMFSGVGKRPQTAVKGGADREIVTVLPVKPSSCETVV
ncbi:unnamed protein product [Arctogadus glacialis]